MQAIQNFNAKIWLSVEEHLTPLPQDSKNYRVFHYLPAPFLLGAGAVSLLVTKIVSICFEIFSKTSPPDPKKDFSAVLKDPREWRKLDTAPENHPVGEKNPNFLFGTATCTWQDSGATNCPDSQWSDWEKKVVKEGNRSGKSADLFTLYQTEGGRKQITDRLHKLGVNSYRFSIEWSHIQPKQGMFDETKLQIYVNFCKHLRDQGIAPMVSLHHFSEPRWFHAMGSFEKEENIQHFVRFAEKVFPVLSEDYKGEPLVKYFCTINEPGIEAFSRYVRGAFSPGLLCQFTKAGHFLYGALKAHCIVYEKLKRLNPKAEIGTVHQYLRFIPGNTLLVPVTRYITRLVNDTALHFFRTGVFELKIPFFCNIRKTDLKFDADFVGLQCYTRPVIGLTGSTSLHGAPMTTMPFWEDPAAIYEAITETYKAAKKPIIITENGISTHNETQRTRYMSRVFYAVRRAQEDLKKAFKTTVVLGYYLWSFCENAEWDMGMRPQAFGAFDVKAGKLEKEPKLGVSPLTQEARAWQKSFQTDESAA